MSVEGRSLWKSAVFFRLLPQAKPCRRGQTIIWPISNDRWRRHRGRCGSGSSADERMKSTHDRCHCIGRDQTATAGQNLETLWKLQNKIWEMGEVPADWEKAIIVSIHKKKVKLDCNSYRGIRLPCNFSKIFESSILQRIWERTDDILTESQAGFQTQWGTIDQVFACSNNQLRST